MQPCALCGSVAVNADGYCVQCGTYRGLAAQSPEGGYSAAQPGYPGYPQQPTSGPGYPSSGAPGYPTGMPEYPSSGPPGYPDPTSGYPPGGVPGYPSSGSPGYPSGGAPGFPTSSPPAGYASTYPSVPPQQQPKRSMLVPLIAMAATFVVLVAGIAIVLTVRGGDDRKANPAADSTQTASPPSTSSSPTPAVGDCLIGAWEVTSHREELHDDTFGKLIFTGAEGMMITYSADGFGKVDYGSGTEYEASYKGKPFVLEIRGVVRYRYTTTASRITVTDVDSTATWRLVYDGEQIGQWDEFHPEDVPSSYTCAGNRMTQKSTLHTTEFRRAS